MNYCISVTIRSADQVEQNNEILKHECPRTVVALIEDLKPCFRTNIIKYNINII